MKPLDPAYERAPCLTSGGEQDLKEAADRLKAADPDDAWSDMNALAAATTNPSDSLTGARFQRLAVRRLRAIVLITRGIIPVFYRLTADVETTDLDPG